jgi:hypothetical protein
VCHPALQLKVWQYGYALGVTSSRRLAGGGQPDYWALNEVRKRHRRALNDVLTQVVELARSVGMRTLGHVPINSTPIAGNAAADSAETMEKLRAERAKIRYRIRRWQQQYETEDPNQGAGTVVARAALEKLGKQ